MNVSIGGLPEFHAQGSLLKQAMRRLVGGVVVVTAGIGEERVGLTATSATALSVEPPTMLVCVNRASGTLPVIVRRQHFCVSVLGAAHRPVAERFAGHGGVRGADRYSGADWTVMRSGASGLSEAQALIDCDLEEVIERHSHAILLGAVREVRLRPGETGALAYGQGAFISLSPP
ncbi:flavin reductase family protein [Methylobacterium sp. NEAU 140]|uniref:flavin reductase family protein n=1 Tax=Methylobacterium sp. NEAU 140 TaxID=3064945 RepID=UPI002734F789|nr:flavin reductase family protein [Methylobacterium sp. NEAU 140]MDP4022645.1 flavin reductase family protein [Methylobacterium sp. NEAU 140]